MWAVATTVKAIMSSGYYPTPQPSSRERETLSERVVSWFDDHRIGAAGSTRRRHLWKPLHLTSV